MRGIAFHESFQPQNCSSETPRMAATLAAGTQIYEMYEELDKHNAAMVGGANPVRISTPNACLLTTPADCRHYGVVHFRRPWAVVERLRNGR
jgi:hypothetical protein